MFHGWRAELVILLIGVTAALILMTIGLLDSPTIDKLEFCSDNSCWGE